MQVQFDPRAVSRADLNTYAHAEGFASVAHGIFRLDREPQFYLRKNAVRHLPLSAAQRTRINLAVPYRNPIPDLLSPQQSAWLADPLLQRVSDGETAYRKTFAIAGRC